MTKYNKKNKMNRNKSSGVNNRTGNRANNNLNRDNNNLMRMSDFDNFDRMFEDFGMPRMGGNGLSGLDRFFGNFQSMSRGMRDLESEMFSK